MGYDGYDGYSSDRVIENHLRFDMMPLEKGKKMPRYRVFNKVLYEDIGVIHWRGGWRQYVFQAKPEVDMSRSCMKEVSEYIDDIMEEWRQSKKGKESINNE